MIAPHRSIPLASNPGDRVFRIPEIAQLIIAPNSSDRPTLLSLCRVTPVTFGLAMPELYRRMIVLAASVADDPFYSHSNPSGAPERVFRGIRTAAGIRPLTRIRDGGLLFGVQAKVWEAAIESTRYLTMDGFAFRPTLTPPFPNLHVLDLSDTIRSGLSSFQLQQSLLRLTPKAVILNLDFDRRVQSDLAEEVLAGLSLGLKGLTTLVIRCTKTCLTKLRPRRVPITHPFPLKHVDIYLIAQPGTQTVGTMLDDIAYLVQLYPGNIFIHCEAIWRDILASGAHMGWCVWLAAIRSVQQASGRVDIHSPANLHHLILARLRYDTPLCQPARPCPYHKIHTHSPDVPQQSSRLTSDGIEDRMKRVWTVSVEEFREKEWYEGAARPWVSLDPSRVSAGSPTPHV